MYTEEKKRRLSLRKKKWIATIFVRLGKKRKIIKMPLNKQKDGCIKENTRITKKNKCYYYCSEINSNKNCFVHV